MNGTYAILLSTEAPRSCKYKLTTKMAMWHLHIAHPQMILIVLHSCPYCWQWIFWPQLEAMLTQYPCGLKHSNQCIVYMNVSTYLQLWQTSMQYTIGGNIHKEVNQLNRYLLHSAVHWNWRQLPSAVADYMPHCYHGKHSASMQSFHPIVHIQGKWACD